MSTNAKDPVSPRIARLKADIADARAGAVDEFWREVSEGPVPLIESNGPSERGDRRLVTLLWRDPGIEAVLVGGGLSADPPRLALEHVAGSEVWYRTVELPSDTRTMYWLVPGGDIEAWRTWSADPLNPRKHE